MNAASASQPIRPMLAPLAGGMLLGLAIGCLVASGQGGSGPAAEHQAAEAKVSRAARGETSGGTTVGKAATMTAFARKHEALAEARKAQHEAAARAMSPSARRKLILELVTPPGVSSVAYHEYMENRRKLEGTILREDVPGLIELLADPNSDLTQSQRQGLGIIYHYAAKLGMRELLDQYAGNELVRQALEGAFRGQDAPKSPFESIRLLKTAEGKQAWELGNNAGWFFSMAAQEDPDRALREAKSVQVLTVRAAALQAVVSNVASKEGLNDAWKLAEEIPEDGIRFKVQSEILQQLLRQGAKSRQELLDHLTAEETNPTLRERLLPQLVQEWTAEDPLTALAWAEEYTAALPTGIEEWNRNRVVNEAMNQYINADPDKAFTRIMQMPPERRNNHLSYLVQTVARRDLESAQRMVESLPASDAKGVRQYIINRMVDISPERAVAYVEQVRNPEERPQLVRSLVSQWSQYDLEASSAWLARQPADEVRDKGISALVSRISRDDPESAALWAMHASTESNRKQLLNQSISNWSQDDPDAARAWVQNQTNQLEPKTVEQLLNNIGKKTTKELRESKKQRQ